MPDKTTAVTPVTPVVEPQAAKVVTPAPPPEISDPVAIELADLQEKDTAPGRIKEVENEIDRKAAQFLAGALRIYKRDYHDSTPATDHAILNRSIAELNKVAYPPKD
jgi:hypothetical protein